MMIDFKEGACMVSCWAFQTPLPAADSDVLMQCKAHAHSVCGLDTAGDPVRVVCISTRLVFTNTHTMYRTDACGYDTLRVKQCAR